MSQSDLIQILEICIKQVEAGRSMDEALAAQPEHAGELRPLLEIAMESRQGDLRVPTAARSNSRKRMLEKAEELRQHQSASGFWRGLFFLRRNAGSLAFAISAVCLLLIALNSITALPGDSFYPVKIAAEQAGVNLANSTATREEREVTFDNHRAEEVLRLIEMNRAGTVRFGGYLHSTQQDQWQAAGIPLLISAEQKELAQDLTGVYVEIKGDLQKQGQVEVASLVPHLDTIQGTLTSLSPGEMKVGDQVIQLTKVSRITGMPQVGSPITVQAARLENSTQLLAITAMTAGSTNTAAPTALSTATPKDTPAPTLTATPMPSATLQPAQTIRPVETHEPEMEDSSPAQPTGEPEHQEDHSPDGSGSDHEQSGSAGQEH